jgi:hypothetical protein
MVTGMASGMEKEGMQLPQPAMLESEMVVMMAGQRMVFEEEGCFRPRCFL